MPAGSAATLVNAAAVKPSFTADLSGTYELRLIVRDTSASSAPATMRVSTENSGPTANAGSDQTVATGSIVALDGSGSSDPDGNPLTFAWSFLSMAPGSTAMLANELAVNPSFQVDRPGQYAIQLLVSDGALTSVADTVIVSTQNSAPVAAAGADTTGVNGDTITLDGSGSIDVDGDPADVSLGVRQQLRHSSACAGERRTQ